MSTRHTPAPNDLRAFWMPFTANRQFKKAPRMFVARRRHALHHQRRAAGARRHRRALVLQRRALPAADHRGDPGAGGGDRLRAGVPDGAPEGVRAGQPADRHRAGGDGARVLHQLRVGVGRDGAEDRHRLSAGDRAGDADPADRPRARLSRGELRRHLGRRHRQQPQVLRHAADRGRPPAAHPPAGAERVLEGPARARRGARRRARADRRAARRLDHRRGDRRAGGGVHRGAGPAEGLSRAAARDLHQAWHPADLRRGDHRVRPHRRAVRRRPLRGDARHDHLRQGPDQRGDPDGRGADHRGDPRRLHVRAGAPDRAVPRLHLFGQPDRGGGGAGDARDLRRGGAVRAGGGARAGLAGGAALAAGLPARDRRPQRGADRRGRAGADRRRADQAGVPGVPRRLRRAAS